MELIDPLEFGSVNAYLIITGQHSQPIAETPSGQIALRLLIYWAYKPDAARCLQALTNVPSVYLGTPLYSKNPIGHVGN